MRDVDRYELAAAQAAELDEHASEIHPAINRFVAEVSSDVETHVTDEVMEARLARVRREAVARAKARPADQRGFTEELAAYGYTSVQTWLRVVRIGMQSVSASGGGSKVSFDADEIDDIAKDTAARAIISFREEAGDAPRSLPRETGDLRVAFLSECVRKLPEAYRSRQLRMGRLAGGLEEWGQPSPGVQIIEALRHCVQRRRIETLHLLQSWTNSGQDSEGFIDETRQALSLVEHRHPETTGLGATLARGVETDTEK